MTVIAAARSLVMPLTLMIVAVTCILTILPMTVAIALRTLRGGLHRPYRLCL